MSMNQNRSTTLSREALMRVGAAIGQAEQATAGEIYCVVARRSSDYRWVILLVAALLALLVPLGLLLAGLDPAQLARALFGGWDVAHTGAAEPYAIWGAALMLALQATIFAVLAALVLRPGAADFLVPRALRRQAVHRAALDQFLAHGIHQTEYRTGVLIYVSLAERMAELVADELIHTKVEQGTWASITGALAASAGRGDLEGGLMTAVEATGQVLAAHVPPRTDNPDELPDRVVLI
jgi:putative membrane protein